MDLGVFGWVRNRRDGKVEVVAEGPEEKVRELALWCRKGPPAARVSHVEETSEPWRGEFDVFEIAF
jgi:acylphosphatase